MRKIIITTIIIIFSICFMDYMQNKTYGASNVIEISSAEEMWNFAESVNYGNTYAGKTVKLTKNINLNCSTSKPWVSIGSINRGYFGGTFDGQGFTISNLYINNKTGKYEDSYYSNTRGTGLFGIIINGSVKNLNIKDSKILLSNYEGNVGFIVGSILSENSKAASINNCKIYNSNINITQSNSYKSNIGGIAGYAYGEKSGIYNCTVNATNNISYLDNYREYCTSCIGGIVGKTEGTINKCYNYQKLTTKGIGLTIGGIVGDSSNICQYCINNGEITHIQTGNIYASCIGGISGVSNQILNSINLGKIIIKKDQTYSNYGAFILSKIGGIAGEAMHVQYAYNKGNIEIPTSIDTTIGGIVANYRTVNNFNSSIKICNCYNTGNIPKGDNKIESGALVGNAQVDSIVLNKCYFTNSINGISTYKEGNKYYYNPNHPFSKYGSSGFKDKGTRISLSKLKDKDFISKINGTEQIFKFDKYNENVGTPIILWEKGISINKLPNKTEYERAKETLNLNGGIINIVYNYSGYNTSLSIKDKSVSVTGFNNEVAGNSRLQFKRGTFVNFFNVKIVDSILPKVTVKYSITKKTNRDVVVTLTANEKIKSISGWKLSTDSKVLTKTYTKNTTQTINVYDLAGNKTAVKINITNIDKTAPTLTVKYSTTSKTNKEVIVTVTANEEIQKASGWVLSKNKKVLTKTYKTNGKEDLTVKDLLGNSITKTIKVTNIDKTAPKLTIKYSKTTKTNQNILVSVTANEEVLSVSGWTLSKDKKVLTKTYKSNGTENLTVKDLAGNSTTKQIKVTNIDKTAPNVTVQYNTTAKTNQNVVVTLKANEQIKEVTNWHLSKDKKTLTRTYSKNTEETVSIYDIAGNKKEQKIIISNIDKVLPKATVEYSKTSKTNQDVVVTITADETVQGIIGWTKSNNSKTLSKTYTQNKTETIEIIDMAGNKVTKEIKITNIDKVAPNINVEYDTQSLTNSSVVVTITANEQIKQIAGWNISRDGRTSTKTYTQNKTETIEILDMAGNKVTKEIKVSNIDKELPKATVEYSKTSKTNQDVVVTITADETVQGITGWTKSNNSKTLSKTYTQNKTETIEILDMAGNKVTKEIKITNIDKVVPIIQTTYSTKEPTNGSVKVTITANEQIKQILGWNISKDGKILSKIYTQNANENVTIKDIAGNEVTQEIKIENINKTDIEAEVEYSKTELTNENVVVTIKSNKELQNLTGWIKKENNLEISKTYTENKEETVTIKDIYGDEKDVEIEVNNIDKTSPKLIISKSEENVTTQPVIVTITADELIQEVEGWELEEDGKALTKQYEENTKENIEIYDLAGNKEAIEINVNNIEKAPLKLEVEQSTTKLTNQNVVITIVGNREIQEVEGWKRSENKLSISKEYAENKEETVEIKDLIGNKANVKISITNIDKTAPKLTISQSEKNMTNQPVEVTILADELIQEVEGWNLEEDGKKLTKTYMKNTKESIEVYDLAGNKQIGNINIQNIQEKAGDELDLDVKYSTTGITNKDVEVEIKANKELQEEKGWTISTDKKTLKKKYTNNTKETITIKDTSGNEEKVEIEIENIDKVVPKTKIIASTTETTKEPVKITIEADERIQEIEGWNLEEDGKTLTKEYSKNTKEEVIIKDLAGNETKQEIIIENIEEEKKQEKQEEAKGDLNRNKQIDIGDIMSLLRHIAQENNEDIAKEHPEWKLNESREEIGDLNKNNKIDIGDIVKLLRFIAAKNNVDVAYKHPEWLQI